MRTHVPLPRSHGRCADGADSAKSPPAARGPGKGASDGPGECPGAGSGTDAGSTGSGGPFRHRAVRRRGPA